MRRTYTGKIPKDLPSNAVVVVGTNPQGRHGKGSALFCRDHYGLIYGQSKGHIGRSYGIETKDISSWPYKSIAVAVIMRKIAELYDYAKSNPQFDFYVMYSGTGTNLNGYKPQAMAHMFSYADIDNYIPENIIFEDEFLKLMNL